MTNLTSAIEWIRGKYALDRQYVSSFGHLDDPWVQRIVKSKKRTMKHYGELIKAAEQIQKIQSGIDKNK